MQEDQNSWEPVSKEEGRGKRRCRGGREDYNNLIVPTAYTTSSSSSISWAESLETSLTTKNLVCSAPSFPYLQLTVYTGL